MAYNIGLWGPSAAGKTAYLCQLYLHILNSPWKVFPKLDADEFLRAARTEIGQNRFPPATSVGTYAKVSYILETPHGSEYCLTLTDQAGTELVQLNDKTRTELNAADALLLLLDSEEHAQTLESDLHGVLSTLHMAADRGAKPDSRPVGICLTKIDRRLLNSAELALAIEHPSKFVLTRIDERLQLVAGLFLKNYRFFPISAAGVFVRDGFVEPATFYDESLELRLAAGGNTVNLLAPFAWLVEQLEGDAA